MGMNQLLEYTFTDFKKKQLGITDLFPTFHDRVRKVAGKGGVLLKERFPKVWHFKVASARAGEEEPAGKKYDVYVEFKNIYPLIKKHVLDKDLWKKDGSGINHRALADRIFDEVDMETSCSCPASLYWGPDYIRTQVDAQYGDQEDRPPKVRNPREKGVLCKHGDLVFDVLPVYKSTFARHLIEFYKKSIEAIEQQVKDGDIEVEEPVKKMRPKRRPTGRTATRKAPPVASEPAPKAKSKPISPSSKGASSASTSATSQGSSSATEPNGSATKEA